MVTTSYRLHPDELQFLLAPALPPATALKFSKRINSLLA
jgi:hypothetical protein